MTNKQKTHGLIRCHFIDVKTQLLFFVDKPNRSYTSIRLSSANSQIKGRLPSLLILDALSQGKLKRIGVDVHPDFMSQHSYFDSRNDNAAFNGNIGLPKWSRRN